jgi:hypothetical protein
VAVEVFGSQGRDCGRSIAGPVHATAFQVAGHQLFSGRFHIIREVVESTKANRDINPANAIIIYA